MLMVLLQWLCDEVQRVNFIICDSNRFVIRYVIVSVARYTYI